MRRTRLEKAIRSIHFFKPRWYSKWFWRHCHMCGDNVMNETMYYTRDMNGMRDYVCMDCFVSHADYIESHPDLFGKLDVTPMREQEAELARINEAMHTGSARFQRVD